MLLDHIHHQLNIEFLILMYQCVPKTDHVFELGREITGDDAILAKQTKTFSGLFGEAEFPGFDRVICQINTLLTRALQVCGNRILFQMEVHWATRNKFVSV